MRRSCAARRRDVLRWRWRPQSAVSSGRSTPQDGDGSRRRTQTFDQCSSGFDLQQRPPWEEVAVLSLVTKGLWAKFEALRLWDGVLQRAWKEPATGEVRWQVVVPHSLRGEVLQAVHGAVGSGHFGVTKTLRRLRLGFYWGQHKRDVEDFCRRCDGCTARKGPTERSHAQLQQFPVGSPMERVGVDVVGPLPCTERGNKYVLTAMDYFTE